jgi:hypothetical protein
MANSDVKAKYIAADTTAADADGVCQSQTPAAGGAQDLTINALSRLLQPPMTAAGLSP